MPFIFFCQTCGAATRAPTGGSWDGRLICDHCRGVEDMIKILDRRSAKPKKFDSWWLLWIALAVGAGIFAWGIGR